MPERKNDKYYPHADRPLECGECKKSIAVRYTEIIGGVITHTNMCGDCPELQKRLYGVSSAEYIQNQTGVNADLACGNCGTTLEEVKRGHRLGCIECYTIFGDFLLAEMQAANRLSPRISTIKKSVPIHIGRAPGEILMINPSSRLLALNEALRETLNREDYEQAAWIRDQIKALTDKEQDLEENKKEPTAEENHD